MSRIELIYAGTRDVIGGGVGGLMAAWVLSDMGQISVTLTGVLAVFGLASIYGIFHHMITIEKENRGAQNPQESVFLLAGIYSAFQRLIAADEENGATENQQEESNRPEPRWPPHRAS